MIYKSNKSSDIDNLSKILQAKRKSIQEHQNTCDNRLFKAVRDNNLKAAEAAVKAGANINARLKAGVLHECYEDMTPFCLAAYDKNAQMVKFLISYGADVNKADRSGFIPLMAAAIQGNAGIINILFKHGADKTKIDSEQKPAFDYAAESGKVNVLPMLK